LIGASSPALYFIAGKFLKKDFWRFVLAFGATLLIWTVIGFASPFGFFFVARVFWTAFSVVLPAFLAWAAWRRRRPVFYAGAALLLIFKFYGEFWEPRNLDITRVQIASPNVKRTVRITHLSDVQTDGINSLFLKARAASNTFAPDLVLFTGDVLNHPSLESEVQEYLRGFQSHAGAYIVSGNVDGGLDFDAFSRAAGFANMDGKSKTIDVGGAAIGLAGVGLNQALDAALTARLFAEAAPADFRILMAHYPDVLFAARGQGYDLIMAGHTHGGQVCLPWGPVVTLSRVPKTIAAGGLHTVNGQNICVSRGLGWEGHVAPRMRTFCRPQIILVEIVPE
jgi:predicted MPP superfamily phosphohydrolase